MKKGKFGIVLCFYPIAAFAAVILDYPLLALAITAAAIFIEKDEWAGRQTLQASMASLTVFFVDTVIRPALLRVNIPFIPFISSLLSTVSAVLSFVVYVAAVVMSILAIIRVRKDEEANFPLFSELAYHIYGQSKPKPATPPAPKYAAPYGVPQQPVQQPFQPQANYPQAPAQPVQPQVPQYTPPMAVQPPYEAPQPQAAQPPFQQPQTPGQNGPQS